MRIKFLVLACSIKHKNRCVAGIDLTNKRLIRLVSEDESTNYAIPKEECYLNRRLLKPLDIIEVELKGRAPNLGAQTENYIVNFPLVRAYIGQGEVKDITPYKFKSDNSPYPFDTKSEFLSRGAYWHKDYSLCLIPAYALAFSTIENSEGNLKTKVSFDVYKFNKEKVRLENYSVTDPDYYIFDDINKSGFLNLGKAYLLISLGQDDNSDNYYKYVSGIIDCTKREDFF